MQLYIHQWTIPLDILTWNFFFSSMSLLSLGGDGSLCMTALSPTDSTGEINNQSFAEHLSIWERNAATYWNVLETMNNRQTQNHKNALIIHC